MTKTYSEKLRDPRWQKKRLEILGRDNFTCVKCGDKETELHVHHLKYNGLPHEADSTDLETLCKHCHNATSFFKIDIIKSIKNGSKTYLCALVNDPKFDLYIINIEESDPVLMIKGDGKYIKEVIIKLFQPDFNPNYGDSDATLIQEDELVSFRTERLMIVRFLLKKYMGKISGFSDHKGELSINWHDTPTDTELEYARKAWESLNEYIVRHFVKGYEIQ